MTGFINIDKTQGASSAKAVSVIKRLTHTPCGHMGTLDPMASGVLPIGIGNACRLFDYFLDKRKTYLATFKFGVDYDTLDTTGTLASCGGYIPEAAQIESVLPELCGEIMQIPPKYSAKNISGKRGYQLARAGVEFELSPKKVSIYSINLIEKCGADSFNFKIECGGGTYIRSIARDMAAALGTTAAMSALVREKSGMFDLAHSVKCEELTAENIKAYILPTDSVLPFESIRPAGDRAKKLFNGLAVNTDLADGKYKIYCENGDFYGLATAEDNRLKVTTKLC